MYIRFSLPFIYVLVLFNVYTKTGTALKGWENSMSCKSCPSEHQSSLNGEIAIHFPGLKGPDKPIVWVFPKLLVYLNCGFTEFAIPEGDLLILRDETDSSAAAS